MIKRDELIAMRAIALCFKPFLKPEEALIYCNLGRTQFAKRCRKGGVTKNSEGYYSREELDELMGGKELRITQTMKKANCNRKIFIHNLGVQPILQVKR